MHLAVCCNYAARTIAILPPYSHTSDDMINDLHWLPALARVRYKVLFLVDQSQQGLAPIISVSSMYKPLVRCDLLIAVFFLHLGPILLYPRTGPVL